MANSSQTKIKHCPDCNRDFPRSPEFFYKAPRSKNAFQRRCKPCHNIKTSEYSRKRNPPKIFGFRKLNDNVKRGIIEGLEEHRTKAELTRIYGIPYGTFMDWQKKGEIEEYRRLEKLKSALTNQNFNNPHIMV